MRTYYCGALRSEHIGQTVTLCGWVHRRRDHGGVIFIDLRDREGLAQVVCHPEQTAAFAIADSLRSEYVVEARGTVRPRPEGTVNTDLKTGSVELVVEELVLLNAAKTPPFPLDEYHMVGEDTRLRFRYLDLRRPEMAERLQQRTHLVRFLRHFLDEQGFLDIETPFLTKATPEGARDYLVPSRTHLGKCFALPQSPQQFKQLLMMAGFDRYYQVVRCFRDEDLRADRQPEFTQLDIEMSFINEAVLQDLMESMIRKVFQQVLSVDLPAFPRLTYEVAMSRYGSDKPNLRSPLELIDIANIVKAVDFQVFSSAANNPDGRVVALKLSEGNTRLTRKQLDDYGSFVGIYGAKGLAYIKVNDRSAGLAGLQSPILKFLPENVTLQIIECVSANTGDIIFFGAGAAKVVNDSMGALRVKLAEDLNLLRSGWHPLWVIDFPMFEWNTPEHRWEALHHPFTAPTIENLEQLRANPKAALSRAYDMVLNGYEIGGGSIRIHRPEMQALIFELLGLTGEQTQEKFGHLIEALKYGCPPHGGIAFGVDRIAMLMSGADSIRDVIAFPKTQTASCPLTGAPSQIDAKQLQELGILWRSTLSQA